jgi:glycosyltransferase involved in cell wall biosynthesis
MQMKLSVITVCLNSRPFIGETIESVLAQDYPDFEHVIVDGGSTDGTLDLIREYAGRDPRIVWTSGPDRGISDAMNKGAAMASGEVLAHLNADDYYAGPDVLGRVAGCFTARPEIEWLTGGLAFVAMDGTFLREARVRRYSFRRLLRGNIILHPATFMRRSAFREAGGFDPGLHYCMDYDLFLRLGSRSAPLCLDSRLTCFRVHPGSRSVVCSAAAYAEEFQVRLNYLRHAGRSTWLYRLDYRLKSQLNRLFYTRLMNDGRKSG